MARRLSKHRFLAGLQCPRMLWWRDTEPDAPELVPNAFVAATRVRGVYVGEIAREHVPGGELVAPPGGTWEDALVATQDALARGVPILYEATFATDDAQVAVDILERSDTGWTLIEAKSSTRVRQHHLPDVALQVHVLRNNGIDVTRSEIMHLDRRCQFPDLSNLFVRVDVTSRVAPLLPGMPAAIALVAHAVDGPLPDAEIGERCHSPRPCPFRARCWPPRPPHHISTLQGNQKRAIKLQIQGIETIDQIPESAGLSPIQERQRRSVVSRAVVVDPQLGAALNRLVAPLAFLDFETIAPPIPIWDGCRPYDPVPVQHSVHREEGDGTRTHHEWLADGPTDPRRACAESLLAASGGARTVLAYYAPFERRCIEGLALAVPELAKPLRALRDRVVDLLPIVRHHVYHPDFNGSFSLKSVLPALVPGTGYDDLTVANGAAATMELERLLLSDPPLPESEKRALRADLLAYCERDTWAMVVMLDALRRLSTGA